MNGQPWQKYRAYLAERKPERKEIRELGAIRYSELVGTKQEKSDVITEMNKLRKKQKTGIVGKKRKSKEDEDSGRNRKKRFLEDL